MKDNNANIPPGYSVSHLFSYKTANSIADENNHQVIMSKSIHRKVFELNFYFKLNLNYESARHKNFN